MTPSTAAIAARVVRPQISIIQRSRASMRAAAGSVSSAGLLMSDARQKTLMVAGEVAGERLDRVLAALVPELSRSRHKALILAGNVAVDAVTIRDPSERVNAGAQIHVALPQEEASTAAAENIPLRIVFEDDDIIVIDKPAGLVMHPAPGRP